MRILAAFLVSVPVLACSCAQFSACDLVQLPVLFVGQVVDGGVSSIRIDPWYNNVQRVRLKVLENFRGLPPGTQTVDVEVGGRMGMCSPDLYFPGHTYLVAPVNQNGRLIDGVCSPTRDISIAPDDVRIGRDYFAHKLPLSVHGRVAVAKADELVDFQLELGEAKPIAGVKVTAAGGGQEYSTVTSADGQYTLSLPHQGHYQLHALLNPYSSEPVEISLGNACTVHNLALSVDSSISGRVLDDSGKPIRNARVGLIDADRSPSDKASHVWFRDAYTEQPDMTFLFESVAVGRHLLIFNPDGPRADGIEAEKKDESTYYPRGSNRATAKVIEIKSGGVHLTGLDLTVGKPVEFRSVTVRVRFTDGAPMDTAQIRCEGAPHQPGDLPWVFEKWVIQGQKGTLQFSAPANRRLQLEVTDAYKRPLKARYTPTYEPGNSPIGKEFVVVP